MYQGCLLLPEAIGQFFYMSSFTITAKQLTTEQRSCSNSDAVASKQKFFPLYSLHLKLVSSMVKPSSRLRSTSECVSRRKVAEYVFCPLIISSLFGSCPLLRDHISTTSPSPNNNHLPYDTTRPELPFQ